MSERQAISECPPASNSPSVTRFIRYQHLQEVLHDSTLVLYPLDLIKIRFRGKMLPITWLCVTCKCIAMLNVMLYALAVRRECQNYSMK